MAITEIISKDFSYTYDPHREPIAEVRPGEQVTLQTEDALKSRISSERDLPSLVLAGHHPAPLTGPLFINGAEPGDTLRVSMQNIEPTRSYAVSCFIPLLGALTSTELTRTLQDPIPERTWIWHLHGMDGLHQDPVTETSASHPISQPAVSDDCFLENEYIHVRVPWRPFMGSIGVAPELEAIASITAGPFGGNMDCSVVRPGSALYLPVSHEGALLYVGDCHANQGQGELAGVALEIPCRVTLVCEVIKSTPIGWPRLVSDDCVMVIGSARPMEDAARIAYAELTLWLEEEFGFTRWEAYQLLTQVGGLHVGSMVNPTYSLVASVEKRYLVRSQ